ncbi:MAG: sensor histidine kinase [Ilumatobacteraceae bacterium]
MATVADIVRQHTTLTKEQTAHLVSLVGEWGMLADLCFADMLLSVSANDGDWVVVAQVRAATGQTLYDTDWVGSRIPGSERPFLAEAMARRQFVEAEIAVDDDPDDGHVMAIPVVHDDTVIAVLTREWSGRGGRQPGELERTYLGLFDNFAQMIAGGAFPYTGRAADASVAPRVGDGAIVLDDKCRVRYASPNATSALHRVGITAPAVGQTLAELGVVDSSVRQAFERRQPVVEEFEQTPEVTLLTRCIPLLSNVEGSRDVTGALMLLRDVSELRRRDRMILSRDATIREIHHRVKNNLQTISSLLRLQGRRLQSDEAKAAVAESVRRIRTIALVHETLSREAGDDVAFIEVVRPLLRLVEEGLQSPDRPMRFTVVGDGGRLPATVVTPLSVVLTELLQNAIDHGFPGGSGGGNVVVSLGADDESLSVRVTDDGRGIEPGFDLASAKGLGLSIVRTLVTTELDGTIEMRPATAEELAAVGLSARDGHTGTVIELRVPVTNE